MYGRRNQRKRGFRRIAVMLLALVMLVGVCVPAMRVNAEETSNAPGENIVEEIKVEGEEVKDEEVKDEETKDEETKDEETKDEETKDEETKDEEVKGEETESESNNDTETAPKESEVSAVQSYINALNAISVRIESLAPDSENYDAEYEAIFGELEQFESDISRAYGAGEITYEEFEALTAQLNDVLDVLFADVEPEEDVSVYADANPDANFIMVGKTFEGITASQIPEDFSITVGQEAGTSYELSKGSATISEDGLTWKWRIDNVGAGTYTVSESNADVENYNRTTNGLGTVEVKAADFHVTYTKETNCNHLDWPVKIDGDQNVLFAAALTTGGCVVISKEPLTATQKATVAKTVIGLGGNWKEPVNFYSIEKNGNGPWSINGKSLEYDPEQGKIWLSKTSDWSHVATLQYSITEASNPDIQVINSYTPNVYDLTVKKTVSGNMYDPNKEFEFIVTADKEMTYAETTAKEITFKLKKDGEATIRVPVGATVSVSEDPDGYTYSFVSITEGVTQDNIPNGNGVSFTMPAKDVIVVINNKKDATVDTGITTESIPYILLFSIAVIGAGVLLMSKRRYSGKF